MHLSTDSLEGVLTNLNDTEVLAGVSQRFSIGDARLLAVLAARAASDKKARDPKVLELGDLIGITDYFVVCSGSNDRQIRTIVEEIEKSAKEVTGIKPRAMEGLGDASWVLIDFGDVVVHVMSEESRAFYAIEKLWSDAQFIDWEFVA
jgi:ribosome-associated protein